MLDYNVPGGKLNRGLSVVDSYKLLKEEELTEDEVFLACTLGWCIEWENYGRKDQASVAKVKELYHTLNLQGVFEDYENKSHEKIIKSIETHPSKAVQEVLKSFLGKIYKRQK
ncbi:fanesyl diphosphate synthase 3 [Artemisia annua]|uniref:Fanesyl diphosphate synthase 3 n=1 Tax=Artemisia annua TaxID=35608 RepID=A0A2U1K9W8_ARTAN|nr:fanesyl diphosphate synthase 3 [Artemisia annua]